MIIKKKLTERDKMDFLTHGGKSKIDRRYFLGQSSWLMGLSFLTPSILDIFSKQLRAQGIDCPELGLGGGGDSKIGVLEYGAAGGGVFSNDFIALTENQGLFSDYEPWGFSPDNNPGSNPSLVSREFGAPIHTQSAFLEGFLSTINPAARPFVTFITFASRSNSDSANNPYSPQHVIASLGRMGVLAPTIGNQANRDSGGRHELVAGSRNPANNPVIVRNAQEAIRIAGISAAVADLGGGSVGADRARRVREAIFALSDSQRQQFFASDLSTQVQTLVNCGYMNAIQVPELVGEAAVNPNNDAIITGNFNLGNEDQAALGSGMKLVMDEFVGASAVQIGNYDNHNGTAIDPYNKRASTGANFGRLANVAFAKDKKAIVNLLSDGGMGRVVTNGVPQYQEVRTGVFFVRRPGDNDRNALAVQMIVHPGLTREQVLVNPDRTQVGGWLASGNVDEDSSVSVASASMCGLALAANWAALHGMESEIARFNNGNNPFSLGKEVLLKKIT